MARIKLAAVFSAALLLTACDNVEWVSYPEEDAAEQEAVAVLDEGMSNESFGGPAQSAISNLEPSESQRAVSTSAAPSLPSQQEIEEAYVWGLPIVAMYRYTVSMGTNVDAINQLFHNKALFEPGILPGGANRDTLYSFGWFDLRDEPVVVSLPSFGDRYFVWQVTDVYAHNFYNAGNFLLGQEGEMANGHTFVMVAPNWEGEAPEGVEVVRAPVPVVNVLYRISVQDTPEDIAAGNTLQQATLTLPLSAWNEGKRETLRRVPSEALPVYRDALVFGQGVTGMQQKNDDFFAVLAEAVRMNPPYAEWDQAMAEGILPKLSAALSDPDRERVLDAQATGFDKVIALRQSGWGPEVNGWQYGPSHHGDYKDDFLRRAFGTYTGGMYPKVENSTYVLAFEDNDGAVLNGSSEYRLKFDADAIPPATAFWSVTAYELGTYDLYPNEHGKYVVGSNHPTTKFGDDGSVEIVFAHTKPAELGNANWIPVPQADFWLATRFYAPTQEVLDLTYQIPGVERMGPD